MNTCAFKDFDGVTWTFQEWTDSQGTHYRITDPKGMTVAEGVGMSMSFQSWCQGLIKQAMDASYV